MSLVCLVPFSIMPPSSHRPKIAFSFAKLDILDASFRHNERRHIHGALSCRFTTESEMETEIHSRIGGWDTCSQNKIVLIILLYYNRNVFWEQEQKHFPNEKFLHFKSSSLSKFWYFLSQNVLVLEKVPAKPNTWDYIHYKHPLRPQDEPRKKRRREEKIRIYGPAVLTSFNIACDLWLWHWELLCGGKTSHVELY